MMGIEWWHLWLTLLAVGIIVAVLMLGTARF